MPKPQMNLIVVPTTREYRDTARKLSIDWFDNSDARGDANGKGYYCCEVGCCDGVTSDIIYRRLSKILLKSPKKIVMKGFIVCDILQKYVDLTCEKLSHWRTKARKKRLADVDYHGACVDAISEGKSIRKEFGLESTDRLKVIFVDIAGTAPLSYVYDVILNLETEFRPHTMVVKSLKFSRVVSQLENGKLLMHDDVENVKQNSNIEQKWNWESLILFAPYLLFFAVLGKYLY